ncbi:MULTISPECIES: fimbrial protein [Serratia]|uniref:fimbrial protein n=1 Tax=Serratia TaxID=613 RepID=UPI0018D7BAA3|nr:type 1 fimbrial protein [Serratia marcescens]MBH3234794.1 type 1 fimbrial protein [Serratia marcescens]
MMRKIALPLTLLGAAMLAPPLQAADGNINVTGQVREGTCRVDDESKSIIVDFGTRLGNSISGFASSSEEKTIKLWDCPVDSVRIKFEGNASSYDGRYFVPDNHDQPGAASNVAFYIYDNKNYQYVRPNEYLQATGLKTGVGSRSDILFGIAVTRLEKNKVITVGKANVNIQLSVAYN